jgi:hypothetical protein
MLYKIKTNIVTTKTLCEKDKLTKTDQFTHFSKSTEMKIQDRAFLYFG